MDPQIGGRSAARKSYARIRDVYELPRLIEVQLDSFRWFQLEGLQELLEEISPIVSFNKNLELHFGSTPLPKAPDSKEEEAKADGFWFGESKYSEPECRDRDMTFAAPLWVRAKLINRETGEIVAQNVFLGDFPLMTENGTFIINGAERVVVSQLIRSPGVYFTVEEDRVTDRRLCYAKLIPNRGAWLEFETSKRDILSVKVDRKRKLPVTVLLRAVGYGSDEEIRSLFAEVDNAPEHGYIASTLERDPTSTPNREDSAAGVNAALLEFYKKLRPGDPPTLDNARSFMQNLIFAPRRYDLGKVGRYKLNRRLDLNVLLSHRTLTNEDLVTVVKHMIQINNGVEGEDDIDHLGNRRVKTVGELIQNQLRVGLLRMERVVRERMSIRDAEQTSPLSLINIRPVVAAIREFFGGSQLSQFMDQTNPLAELTHKRRLSALGPGGLRRERAGFDVRDVHNSHYGRICPIETPEGPNIGLIGSLASYGRINEFGFIETPYRRVINRVPNRPDKLVGHTLRERVVLPDGTLLAESGTKVDEALAAQIACLGDVLPELRVTPIVTDEIVFLSADEEDRHSVAQANAMTDDARHFVESRVSVRRNQRFLFESPDRIEYMDVSPKQIVSVSAALIPFLEHDDANRALMGSNMQRQAVPLLRPEAPIVGTGIERQAAVDSGQVVVAQNAGEVISASSDQLVILEEDGARRIYRLRKYQRSNQSTCIDQRPVVHKGDRVAKGQVLADSSSTDLGEMALGENVLVAFLSWEGGNYEDAILISERLIQDDKFTSIHIEKHELEARDTKLGAEEITRDIPNVGEDVLKDLDEHGIVRIGAVVNPGDILVGKITPKGETELSPEEKLLRAIFGEKAREVKDSSLRLPHGEYGKVVDIREFSRDEHRDLPAGVERMVRVSVAQRRKLMEGDKMAGRHGNKGVISRIVPVEDMPFLPDGTPVDIILNPLGVPARMNIGQVLETHVGWAAARLGFRVETPVFDGAREREIEAELARAWLADRAWEKATKRAWDWRARQPYAESELKDDHEVRALYLAEWLGERGYDPERAYRDEMYARRAVLREWLAEEPQGYDPDTLLSFEDDDRPLVVRQQADEMARIVCLREWLKWVVRERMRVVHLEPAERPRQGVDASAAAQPPGGDLRHDQPAGAGPPPGGDLRRDTAPDAAQLVEYRDVPETPEERAALYAEMARLSALSDQEVVVEALRVSRETNKPLPTWGKTTLYNGKTGEPFDQPVTVGIIHMMKLHHLVEDKVHARSTGPYSLVTQQPLGGKAQFGGQRFGEMEVWALEAYGAAHSLQEMLTVKSDDVTGRVKTYEAIVKGETIESPGVPEGFRVLVKELQSLGLSVEVVDAKEEIIQFGREDTEEKLPNLGFSLSLPGPMSKGLD
jgi:DNA-directed RNA polymerase subunit beta